LCKDSRFGAFWSVTKYKDIMQVEVNHQIYSSDIHLGGINIRDVPDGAPPADVHRDGPAQARRAAQDGQPDRRAGQPGHDGSDDPRAHLQACSTSLPRNETFNWVDKVSIELTTLMLATLFDFPASKTAAAHLLVRCGHGRPHGRRSDRQR
jgi:hypothetical protein